MAIALTVVLVIILAINVIQGLAFLELVRQVAQIREQLLIEAGPTAVPNVEDMIGTLPVTAGLRTAMGEPFSWTSYLGSQLTVLVFLHRGCLTCHVVAEGLSGLVTANGVQVGVVPVVEATTESEAVRFIGEMRLPLNRSVLDIGSTLAKQLNLSTKPVLIAVEGSELIGAAVVRSPAQVEMVINGLMAPRAESQTGHAHSRTTNGRSTVDVGSGGQRH